MEHETFECSFKKAFEKEMVKLLYTSLKMMVQT